MLNLHLVRSSVWAVWAVFPMFFLGAVPELHWTSLSNPSEKSSRTAFGRTMCPDSLVWCSTACGVWLRGLLLVCVKWVLNQKYGKTPKSSKKTVFSIIFTIHFGGTVPLLLETSKLLGLVRLVMGCDFSDWILGLESGGRLGDWWFQSWLVNQPPPNVPPPERPYWGKPTVNKPLIRPYFGMIQFDGRAYFSNGLVQPPPRRWCW